MTDRENILSSLLDKNGNLSSRKFHLWKHNKEQVSLVEVSFHNKIDVGSLTSTDFKKYLYMFKENISLEPLCEVCEQHPKSFRNFQYGFGRCCSPACSSKLGIVEHKKAMKDPDKRKQSLEKRKQTNIERFGVEHVLQDADINKKSRKTLFERHGIHSTRQWPEVQEKCNKTIWERYGVTNIGFINPLNFRSKYEIFLENYIKHLGFHVECNKRWPDKKYEIDVFIPEKNIGIEVHGTYWHCLGVNAKTTDYHLEKYTEARDNGIYLIQLFTNELEGSFLELTKRMLCTKLGINRTKIYARDCTVRTDVECGQFLENNHPRGWARNSLQLSLLKGDKIVSCMTFKIEKNIAILNRYSSIGVTGAFSKLLKSAIKFLMDKSVTQITSFLDLRYSDESNNVYTKHNFKELYMLKPDYMYFWKGNVYHKFSMRKDKLLRLGGVGNTESELAESLGMKRLYDAGKIKYGLDI